MHTASETITPTHSFRLRDHLAAQSPFAPAAASASSMRSSTFSARLSPLHEAGEWHGDDEQGTGAGSGIGSEPPTHEEEVEQEQPREEEEEEVVVDEMEEEAEAPPPPELAATSAEPQPLPQDPSAPEQQASAASAEPSAPSVAPAPGMAADPRSRPGALHTYGNWDDCGFFCGVHAGHVKRALGMQCMRTVVTAAMN